MAQCGVATDGNSRNTKGRHLGDPWMSDEQTRTGSLCITSYDPSDTTRTTPCGNRSQQIAKEKQRETEKGAWRTNPFLLLSLVVSRLYPSLDFLAADRCV